MVSMEQGGFGSVIYTPASTAYFGFEYNKSSRDMGSRHAQIRKTTDGNSNAMVFC